MTAYVIGVLGLAFGLLILNLLTTRKKIQKQSRLDFPPSDHPKVAEHHEEEQHRGAAMSGVR